MLVVIAKWRARPGTGDEIAAVLKEHVAATRTEPGCVQFNANRSAERPDEFVMYERYDDEQAFQTHRASPHFQRYMEERIAPLLDERQFDLYTLVEPE